MLCVLCGLAAEIREQLPAVAEEAGVALRFRTGVNTGTVFTGEGENLATGDAVNVAARLEQAAGPGDIFLGPETLRLVRDAVEVEPLEPLALKGKSEPLPAFRLLRSTLRRRGLPAIWTWRWWAGRRARCCSRLGAVVSESGCHLFTLMGEPGWVSRGWWQSCLVRLAKLRPCCADGARITARDHVLAAGRGADARGRGGQPFA